MKFQIGIYEDLDYETYASIPAWRSHDLTTLIKCPYSWKHQKPLTESPALLEGRVQHTVFLEHEKFDEEFVIAPELDRRTKAGKEQYSDWLMSVGDRTAVKKDMYDICMERREVVEKYIPNADDKVELTVCFYWATQPCKARLDWYTGTDIWDLKTCRDASPRGFRSAINNFGYYQQAAYYLTACRAVNLRADKFFFLAQEKVHPYAYGVYTLSEEAIQYGVSRNEQALKLGLRVKDGEEFRPFNLPDNVEFDVSDLQ